MTLPPTPFQENTIVVDSRRLRYSEGGQGPAVLLIHGIGASLEFWRFTQGALADQHRVLAIDLPGSGFSERGDRVPTLAEIADIMVHFLDGLGLDRVSLIGNSLGGLVCLETALRHPDRVDRLILSNTVGLGRELSIFWRLMAVPGFGPFLIEINRWLAQRGWRNLFYQPQDGESELIARCKQWVSRPELTETIVVAARSGVNLKGQRPEIIKLDRLGELTMPTLLVWGRQDPVVPLAHAERAVKLIRNAQLAVIEGCGHCPQLQQPVAFNQIARAFLRLAS